MSDMGSNQSGGQQAPAGWYMVDGQQRYWNGTNWTEHVAPADNQQQQPSEQQQPSGQAGFGQQQPSGQAGFGQQQPSGQAGFGQQQQPFGQPGFGQPTSNQGFGQQSSSDEQLMASLAHFGGIIFGFIPSLVLWLIKKDESPYIERHAKEALNFQICIAAIWFGSLFLGVLLNVIGIPVIGYFLGLLQFGVIIASIVFSVIGGLAAKGGNEYTYPVSVRLIK